MNKAIYMGLHYQSKVWDQCWKKKKNITFIQFIKLIFQSLNWSKVKLNTWVIITHFITISTCLLQEKKSVVNSTSQHQLKEPLRAKFSFDCWLFSHSVSVSVIVNEVSSLLAKVLGKFLMVTASLTVLATAWHQTIPKGKWKEKLNQIWTLSPLLTQKIYK